MSFYYFKEFVSFNFKGCPITYKKLNGVYVGSMENLRTLNMHKVREFIQVGKPFFKKLVKEKSAQGR